MTSSTPTLSEAARHVILPKGIVTTGWPSVRETCLRVGITFDPWQDGAGKAMFHFVLNDCIVSGNLATGYGAAGGGIYSVGGGDGTSGIDASACGRTPSAGPGRASMAALPIGVRFSPIRR